MKNSGPQQRQINIRLDDATLERIDTCRTAMRQSFLNIPTRSDVVRMAIKEFLENRGYGEGDSE